MELEARIAGLERFRQESTFLRNQARSERDLRSLTGDSAAMKRVRQAIQQVAATDATVLILGETGTGKELVARAIHQLSPRRDHMMVAVNCAALAPGIIASELFGHEQGAFTGANKQRPGRFELADNGSVFLDEVGELPLETQVMLLRVLQERTIERVGSGDSTPINVRVIAATHRDLPANVAKGTFRADLYFRLNVFPISMPPLRDRPEDIPHLVRHFVLHLSRRLGKNVVVVPDSIMSALMKYSWPGNVRELENIIERSLIISSGETLELDLHWLRSDDRPAAPSRTGLAAIERQTIQDALIQCNGKVYGADGAASLLGLKPTTLYGKMRKHKIARRGSVDVNDDQ